MYLAFLNAKKCNGKYTSQNNYARMLTNWPTHPLNYVHNGQVQIKQHNKQKSITKHKSWITENLYNKTLFIRKHDTNRLSLWCCCTVHHL